jgi:poly(hydroxyalkanoate) depolymerase family esterase
MNFNAETFARLREATGLLQSEGPMAATAAIQRALQGMPLSGGFVQPEAWTKPVQTPNVMRDINPRDASAEAANATNDDPGPDLLQRFKQAFRGKWSGALPGLDDVIDVEPVEPPASVPGTFVAGAYANAAGKRAYKLYIPKSYTGKEGEALPLVVMLHGCKQNPDDFAAGTRMNQLAEEQGCLVLYPAQAQNANGSNCWNWFKKEDQQRDRGEPAILAGMIGEIAKTHHVDAKRIYIAGLSAGGAMAAVMSQTYPELFAAVGIHSGLAHGAAHDVVSAFAAMKNGMKDKAGDTRQRIPVPVIVFHGDSDATVHPRNGDQAFAQCTGSNAPKASRGEDRNRKKVVSKGAVPNGRSYTREALAADDDRMVAEQWTIHGAGHAWSGGSRRGSYTDPAGPDASKEMLRFFLSQRTRGPDPASGG